MCVNFTEWLLKFVVGVPTDELDSVGVTKISFR